MAPKIINTNTVELNKIIFDSGKFFVIDALIIHKKWMEPSIKMFGKISGINNLPIRYSNKESGTPSFIYQVFYGSFLVQLLRTVSYFIIFVILSISIIGSIVFTVENYKKMRRKRHAKKIKKLIKQTTLNNLTNSAVFMYKKVFLQ